jgi:hypothetical protein
MSYSSNNTGSVWIGGPRYEVLRHFAGTIALGRLGDLADVLVEVVGLEGPITVIGSLDECDECDKCDECDTMSSMSSSGAVGRIGPRLGIIRRSRSGDIMASGLLGDRGRLLVEVVGLDEDEGAAGFLAGFDGPEVRDPLDGVVGVDSVNINACASFLGAPGGPENEEKGAGILGGVDGRTGPDIEAAFTFI